MPLKIKSVYDLNHHITDVLEDLEEAITGAVQYALETRDMEWAEAVWGEFDIDGMPFNDACHHNPPGPNDAAKYVISLRGRHKADHRKPQRKRPRRGGKK